MAKQPRNTVCGLSKGPSPDLAVPAREGAGTQENFRIARLDAMVVDPRESCDLSEIVIAVASVLIPPALNKGKRIEACGVDGAVWAASNADLVLHAVRNLVDNAIAYSGASQTIEITVGKDGTIKVIDHGPGVPAYLAEHVFRRFWRSDRSGEGAGLGLSIVRRSMALCGGQVTLAETPGGEPPSSSRSDRGENPRKHRPRHSASKAAA